MSRFLSFAILLFIVSSVPQTASARDINLRPSVCKAVLPDAATDQAVIAAPYRCGADGPDASTQWLWLRLDAAAVRNLPSGWQLRIDETRFDQMAVLVAGRQAAERQTMTASSIGTRWAPGGLLSFTIDAPGREIDGLYLGFHRIDDLSFMRKIVASSMPAAAAEDAKWLLLMGAFAGILLSALLYNMVIHAGQRLAFQRWYLVWVVVALAYGLTWTNTAAFVIPDLVGPIAVRIYFVLVGLMVAAGSMFFFAVIEDGMVPPRLVAAGRLLAGVAAVLGCMAAADRLFPAVATDRLFNYAIAGGTVIVTASGVIAAWRGSRVIWFYLLGWTPILCVFLARLSRNFGYLPQNDIVDMATFAALAFEALMLSLAIADRFRLIRQELELARQTRERDLRETTALRLAAQTDFLTGLGNRSAFQEKADALIATGTPFDLFLIDVDYLKDTNDRLGHAAGDTLLRCVAVALSEVARHHPGTLVARIGGDEYAMLYPGDSQATASMVDCLADLQGKDWHHADHNGALSLSAGSARYPDDATGLNLLFQHADLALYTAKQLGRSRHCRYDPLQRTRRDFQVELIEDVEAAIRKGEFELYLQPIMSIREESLCGHEALLRWNHPVHGLLAPDRFADVLVAERVGLRIQEHVLDLALLHLRDHGDDIGLLCVNFTAAQLSGPRAAKRVLGKLAQYEVSASSLCVEVTEGVMLNRSADSILSNLRSLHDAGVCIALDDFGTGYASLVHLRQLPVDRLKIDRSFVAGLDADSETTAIVRAIVGLGRAMGKVVVAEGIETEAQALHLRQLGCQFGQGYLYGRPMPHRCPTPARLRMSGGEYR